MDVRHLQLILSHYKFAPKKKKSDQNKIKINFDKIAQCIYEIGPSESNKIKNTFVQTCPFSNYPITNIHSTQKEELQQNRKYLHIKLT